jgi:uncharacterized protein (DUF169 family)
MSILKLLEALDIKHIISIRFCDSKPENIDTGFLDTACTAMARSLNHNKCLMIDRTLGQSCPGGNHFLCIKKAPLEEVYKTYINDEQVFQDTTACQEFLSKLPQFPQIAQKRFLLLTPFQKEIGTPDIITILANPAQVARLLGLSVYQGMNSPLIIPAAPTCLALYASLSTNQIHINLIDYYDRYYQGCIENKLIWDENKMIITMPYTSFVDMANNLAKSAHGTFTAKITPQKVTSFR